MEIINKEKEYPSRSSWLSAYICAGMTGCFAVSQVASSHAIFSCLTAFAMMCTLRSGENKNWLIGAHFASVIAFMACRNNHDNNNNRHVFTCHDCL